ncbi:glutathione S-transferase family protein [uncultured Alsobacter sp.]|uniref:glutathione S-transferase family protein n=1 Tax=uncultured Alsobacter sp. TaxID=1748258 RepID=UPI0025DF0894|nr:glutathione S-transferase family protein [uncultured Alsobacter sp.]
MTDLPRVTLYHSPNTRSTGARILLEELGAPYDLHALNMMAGEQRSPAFLAVNPMGKVPTVTLGDAMVSEQVAVYLFLADLYPGAGLAPSVTDPLRGPYLRWMALYGSSFEPAVMDRAMKREPPPARMSAYGSFEDLYAMIEAQVAKGPWLLGDRFTAADVLWGTALGWVSAFDLVPKSEAIGAYAARVAARPAAVRVREADAALAAEHKAAAGA